MNNTKWNEIFQSFYKNECTDNHPIVYWRTRDLENGYISRLDGTWTHFGCEPRNWEMIDYLQIQLTESNREFVIKTLKKIHVPGVIAEDIVTIYGYKQDVDYI